MVQSNWPRAFWPISQEPYFSQIWDLRRNTVNSIKFQFSKKVQLCKKSYKSFNNVDFSIHTTNHSEAAFKTSQLTAEIVK